MLPTSSTSKSPCVQKTQQELEVERIAKNQAATEVFAKKEYKDEKFVSSVSELSNKNKRTKSLNIPENVKVAESRLNIRSNEQRRILEKELRQANILARQGNTVWLTPEPGEYGKRTTDAIVNGIPFEFRNIEGNARTLEWEFGDIKKKGSDVNVFINIESDISKSEAWRRIAQVLKRHPEYTGKIVVSFQNGKTYFWKTDNLR